MQTRVAAAITAIGLALLVFMVVVEGEPGALPLALVLGGLAWFFIARRRSRGSVR